MFDEESFNQGVLVGVSMTVTLFWFVKWSLVWIMTRGKSEAWKIHRKHWHRLMRTRDVPCGVMLFAEDGYRLVYDNSWLFDTGRTFTESGVTMPILEPRTVLGTVVAWSKRMFARQDLSRRH